MTCDQEAKITDQRAIWGTVAGDVLVYDHIIMHAIGVIQAMAESSHAHVGVCKVWVALSTDWIDMRKVGDIGGCR